MGHIRPQFQILGQLPGDGRKRVAVEIAEWGQAVASSAQLHTFIEPHSPLVLTLPQLLGWLIALAGWLVEGPLALAQGGVGRGHELPIKELKPGPFHDAYSGFV